MQPTLVTRLREITLLPRPIGCILLIYIICMRAYPVIIALWMYPCILFSQTNISGIVNSYRKVIGINTVQSGLKLDDASGINVNDRVMVIQMKGATVNTT